MQAGGEGFIPEGLDIGKDISLRISLSRGSTTEVMKIVLDTSVIEANNRWINSEVGRGVV